MRVDIWAILTHTQELSVKALHNLRHELSHQLANRHPNSPLAGRNLLYEDRALQICGIDVRDQPLVFARMLERGLICLDASTKLIKVSQLSTLNLAGGESVLLQVTSEDLNLASHFARLDKLLGIYDRVQTDASTFCMT